MSFPESLLASFACPELSMKSTRSRADMSLLLLQVRARKSPVSRWADSISSSECIAPFALSILPIPSMRSFATLSDPPGCSLMSVSQRSKVTAVIFLMRVPEARRASLLKCSILQLRSDIMPPCPRTAYHARDRQRLYMTSILDGPKSGLTAKVAGPHLVPFRTQKLSPPTFFVVLRCASPREAQGPSGPLDHSG